MVRNDDKLFESGYVALTGFISTSMIKTLAESFAWSNKESGAEKTLFEIIFMNGCGYYVMDMSAFPEEEEVVLTDGTKFEVISVETTQDKDGNNSNFIVLNCEGYKEDKAC